MTVGRWETSSPSGVKDSHPGGEGLMFLASLSRGRAQGVSSCESCFYIRAGLQVGPGPPTQLSMALVTQHAVVILLFCCSPEMEAV